MLITRLDPLSHRPRFKRLAVVAVTVELLLRVPKVRYTALREYGPSFLQAVNIE